MKHCYDCDRDLPLIEFYKDKHRKDGRSVQCKLCKRIRVGQIRPTPEGLAKPTKVCGKCKEELPRSAFGVNNRRWDGLQAYCNLCKQSDAMKSYGWINELKESRGCQDCPEDRRRHPGYRLDFDHVRGVKLHNVSSMMKQRFSRHDIEAEIAKCDVVCANCHRDRHHQRYQSSAIRRASNGLEESPGIPSLETVI
jgi:hypothetical protein